LPTYHIHHRTCYTYEEEVPICHNLAHLRARRSPRHHWLSADMEIHPTPATRVDRTDYFGNTVTFFAIQEPHRELMVTTDSEVRVDAAEASPGDGNMAWEAARDSFKLAGVPHSPASVDAFQFTFPSPCISGSEAVLDYARPSFATGRPLVEAVLDLGRRIHSDFRYDAKSTTVATTLPEVLKARAGVCQDFAHLQIGCLRALGLAARYVSGYLLTTPPAGEERLIGADASHAWLSVYLPGPAGGAWMDVDPTNDVVPSDKHITLAWGRDFADVSPLRGVTFGGRDHTVRVSVDVTAIG
jgi:transglutaminase-like putative cysteine protease